MRSIHSMALAPWFVMVVSLTAARPVAAAQQSSELAVPRLSVVKSQPMRLAATEELRVELKEPVPPGALVSVFVHATGGELVCRDDPEEVTDAFRCRPPAPGAYYVILQNTSDAPVTAILRRERVRSVPVRRTEFATVGVYFATTRQQIEPGSFGFDTASRTSYGYSRVSIPRDHRIGELEGPSILRLELRSDPEKHVKVLDVNPETEDGFFGRVAGRVDLSRTRDALLFIHGFNVTFEDALRRTAQISYDLSFDGAPILFSWPSQGSPSPLAYQRDMRNADLAAEQLFRLVDRLSQLRPGIRVHVIAHSMGNRVLTAALQRMASTNRRLQQVALLAPDVDAELFRQAAPAIARTARRVTLYASSEDLALSASGAQAGYRRAGQAGDGIVVVPGVDTIDASAVDTSVLGLLHSYYADNASILADLFWLMRDKSPAERFRLSAVQAPAGTYWRFLPAVR